MLLYFVFHDGEDARKGDVEDGKFTVFRCHFGFPFGLDLAIWARSWPVSNPLATALFKPLSVMRPSATRRLMRSVCLRRFIGRPPSSLQ
jgi:hypothetical protein